MDQGNVPVKARHKIPRGALWLGLGLIAANLSLVVGYYLSKWMPAAKALERERAVVKEGLAALRAERVLRPAFFEPPEDGNSWEQLNLGLQPLEALSPSELVAFPSLRDEGEKGPSADEAAKVLAKVEPLLDHLKRALRRSWVAPDYRYEESFALKMPLVAKSLQACKILGDRAADLHEAGRSDEAVDYLVTGWGVADHLAVKGGLVNELVRIVENEIMADRLRAILADHRLGPAGLARLGRTLGAVDESRPDLLQTYKREDLVWRSGIIDIAEGRIDGKDVYPSSFGSPRHLFSLRIMAADYFKIQAEFMAQVEEAVRLPYRERLRRLEELVTLVVDKRNPLVALLVPQMSRCWRNQAREVLTTSLARLAVAVARYREDRGAYPASLNELVPKYLPKIPVDEVTGQPFGFVVLEDSAKVYSWGEDGDDDGGRAIPGDEIDLGEDSDGDIVWTVKRRK